MARIKAQYIGKPGRLAQGVIYYFAFVEDRPNTIIIQSEELLINYDSVQHFFEDWKLN